MEKLLEKIAIRFGDNDFYNCFEGVLQTLDNAFKYHGKLPTDKKLLCVIINQLIYGHYLLFQNQFEYNEEKDGVISKRTKQYLQITPEKILINEEVDNFIRGIDWDNHGWDNHETFVMHLSKDVDSDIFSV